jgi:hypothetical protein
MTAKTINLAVLHDGRNYTLAITGLEIRIAEAGTFKGEGVLALRGDGVVIDDCDVQLGGPHDDPVDAQAASDEVFAALEAALTRAFLLPEAHPLREALREALLAALNVPSGGEEPGVVARLESSPWILDFGRSLQPRKVDPQFLRQHPEPIGGDHQED